MANNIIFLCATRPTIGRVGTPGKTVTMLSDNGILIQNKYLVGEDEPYEKYDEFLTHIVARKPPKLACAEELPLSIKYFF